jgi:hypothetical protein
LLVEPGAALVGIDSLNTGDGENLTRPVHTRLPAAGIPIVEDLCHLDQLPNAGFRFSAVPVTVRRCGAFPVSAFAVVDGQSAGCRRLAGGDWAAATALLSRRSFGEPSLPGDSIRRSVTG